MEFKKDIDIIADFMEDTKTMWEEKKVIKTNKVLWLISLPGLKEHFNISTWEYTPSEKQTKDLLSRLSRRNE